MDALRSASQSDTAHFGQISPNAWRIAGKTMTIDEYIENQRRDVNSTDLRVLATFTRSLAGQAEGIERQRASGTQPSGVHHSAGVGIAIGPTGKGSVVERNPLIRLVRTWLPVTDSYHGADFTIRRDGRRVLTPLAMVLIMVEATDVLFAVDSIPAIFGITHDPFIIYTSNVCAILGLRSLYFLLAGAVHKFVYLKPALAIILSFIGIKMLLVDVFHIPTAASLGFIGLALLAAAILSLLVRHRSGTAEPAGEPDRHSPPVSNMR
jgi:hypothetical protein